MTSDWNSQSSKQRSLSARVSPDIDLQKLLSYMPHQKNTAEAAVALKEKRKRYAEAPKMSWDPEAVRRRRNTPAAPIVSLDTVRVKGKKPRRSMSSSDEANDIEVQSTSQRKARSLRRESIPQKPSQSVQPVTKMIARQSKPLSAVELRKRLEKEWNTEIRRTGAASISIVNDVDDEAIPTTGIKFTYMEYSFAPYVHI